MTKREMLEKDLKYYINDCKDAIEETEFATDNIDHFHRGMLAAYESVLRDLALIDEQFEIDERIDKMLGIRR